jgi:multimeric flavodoxin WrbA
MSDKPFKILGLCNGSIQGNSEILLKAALKEIESSSSRPTEISWIHVPSVLIPRNPKPLKSSADISLGNVSSLKNSVPSKALSSTPQEITLADDRRAVLDAILDADALVFATPIYSHQPPGFLKAMTDRILGPFTDAAFVRRVLERQAAGDPKFTGETVDARVLKPRVVGFLVVGGSTSPDQHTMALPTLYQLVYPIHAKVVDQVLLDGYGRAGSVIFKNGGQAVERAKLLGRNVASQLGKQFDDAVYLGPKTEGSCPHCHLSKLDFFGGDSNEVGCVVCGTRGNLVVENGKITPVWTNDTTWSCLTMEGKQLHADHIHEAGMKEEEAFRSFTPAKLQEVKNSLLNVDIRVLPLPSVLPQSGAKRQKCSRLFFIPRAMLRTTEAD